MRIAIIPARGGSKRIPRKNIKDFSGKPIIAYSIEAALASGCFDKVIVSTDDQEIADVARLYGAEVPFFRSNENSGDYTPIGDVIDEVLLQLEEELNIEIEYFCCLFPTAPLITGERIERAYDRMIERGFDGVFTILEYSYPIQRALIIENELVSMKWPENLKARSQDLPKSYHDAGQLYWMNRSIYKNKKTLWTDHTGVVVLSEMEVQDIDTLSDWKLAELKYKLMIHE